MEYIILDLEFNGTYSKHRHKFVNEIIEFGAVKCDEQLNIIETFSELVKPQISKKLNSHVSALTHITIDELKKSNNSFSHVMSKFRKFLGDGVLMTWSNSDVLVLIENYKYFYGNDKLPFMQYYVNAQKYCERAIGYNDKARQLGLSTCAEMLGITFEDDSLHRAYNDAELTAACFKALYDGELLQQFLYTCDDDFYRRLNFKNYNICDLKDPNVDRKEMFFNCENCGRRALRRSKWRLKNRSFRANFRCLRCRRDFEGRIIFKQCYDHVDVTKKTAEVEHKEKKRRKKSEQKPTE
ncbi:exonuclease domain-containing protein [Ruminococcus sp.]|uniref:exonuclease domain-containing protein n=1 Tax=Ruminococcus sp. TaxID=41978 RepID=UPI00386F4C32